MARSPHRVRRGVAVAIAGIFCLNLLAPIAALADTNLVIGGAARIAYANGDDVRLRKGPGFDSTVLAMIPEGSLVDVLEGPIWLPDGTAWYGVSVDGTIGYIVADYLALDGAGASEPAAEPAAPEPAPTDGGAAGAAPGVAVAVAAIVGTNGDGARCRAGAGTGTPIITVLTEGASVELTGDLVGEWQPVNCAGRGGYVHQQFVGSGDEAAGRSGADGAAGADGADATSGDAGSSGTETRNVTGTAAIVGTNGDGVVCRARAGTDASVITLLPEGTVVELRGGTEGEWQPVYCGSGEGWVYASFVAAAAETPDRAAAEDDVVLAAATGVGAVTGTAVVTGTNGGGLRCRNGVGYDRSVITILPEGSTVELRGTGRGEWQPVWCAGRKGYVHGDYLGTGGAAPSGNAGSSTDATGSAAVNDGVTGAATVTNASGGLRCRNGAGYDRSVITTLANGSQVELRGTARGEWQPVWCAGRKGYVHVNYLSYGGTSGGSTDAPVQGGSVSGLVPGDYAKVTGTNGDGVRLRSRANSGSAVITVVAEGKVVRVRSGGTGVWVAVTYQGSDGFIHGDYLTRTSNDGGSTTSPPSGNSGPAQRTYRLSAGDRAVTKSSLNLRYEPSGGSGVAATVPQGTVVEITGTPTGGYYPVSWDGLRGYLHTNYLSKTSAALSIRGGSGAPSPSPSNGGGGNSATGNAIVDYAMQYLGYPYVWATAGPSSFDCSGFTYWVALNVLGIDIGRGLFTQIEAGTPVARDALQPGDLVFFQNTYTWGLSHVGIYIGNNKMINAENEETDVKISDISSPYYASRWYGAVRLT